MIKKILSIFIFVQIIFCSSILDENDYHVSLVVHERLINEFFKSVGEIKGGGNSPIASYSWRIENPYVEIENDTIFLYSEVKIKVGEAQTTKEIKGYLSASFDQENNTIDLKIKKASVIIDVDLFGSKYIIAELNMADYFPNIYKLNGPNINKTFDFKLPNGIIRIVNTSISESYLKLKKDKIEVHSKIEFHPEN